MMDRYRGPTVAEAPTTKPPGKRLRKKLQKIGTFQRQYQPNYSDAKSNPTCSANGIPMKSVLSGTNGATPSLKSCLPLPDALGDGGWLEQLRSSGYLVHDDPSIRQLKTPLGRPSSIVPELAHLSINDDRRISFDTNTNTSADSSARRVTRRYAKTPVSRIGQLESLSVRPYETAHKVSSVELIAESYRALLESRCSLLRDPTPEPVHSQTAQSCDLYLADDLAHDRGVLGTLTEVPELTPVMGSPMSDNGTLVAFEEDAIYFKPAFTPDPSEPPSPLRYQVQAEPTPLPVSPPDSPSLQICFDLLTRELSSAAGGTSIRPSTETSALQIWVMIEAYERLRDQVGGMGLADGQAGVAEAMFDMWLKALYALHDQMTSQDGRSESDYGNLNPEELV
ncbi:hypothetical protein F5Y15DRAFT_385266 [Xylariaceae sp. FL0016]|nr:hypothetical protein F5Y15DRAFT_385266 [Xylariaceae sp. FL0016]